MGKEITMLFSLHNSLNWCYPDNELPPTLERLDLTRNGHASFQILGPMENSVRSLRFLPGEGLEYQVFEMLPVTVNENTNDTILTTLDWSRCKDFVTRQAPFDVYDALRPLGPFTRHPLTVTSHELKKRNRMALFVTVKVASDDDAEGSQNHDHPNEGPYDRELVIMGDVAGCEETMRIPVSIHDLEIPDISSCRWKQLDFFCYENIARDHGVEEGSEDWFTLYRTYIRLQLQLRLTHIQLPVAKAMKDIEGTIVDFDFSLVERCARIALEEGAPYICGAPIAHWKNWDDPTYYLLWNMDISTESTEGYLLLKRYFTIWRKIVEHNDWADRVFQSLADEPQTKNDTSYRALAAIFRQQLPSVPIMEAVEATRLGGAIDIWIPKQDTFEKQIEEYRRLQRSGETFWFYTCAYPGGPIMNRSLDLPLTQSRLVLWRGRGYGLDGFLHWGFNFYIGDDVFRSACCPHLGSLLPAGDAHIVYPQGRTAWPSVRFMAQMEGAEDVELLYRLEQEEPELFRSLIDSVTTDFRNYTHDGQRVFIARRAMLEALESQRTSANE